MIRRGAGAFGAGRGPAGFDPLVFTKRVVLTLPPAAFYDPAVRDIILVDGVVQAIHPVDQRTIFLATLPLGSMASAPEAGVDLERIRNAPPAALQATLNDAYRVALRQPIADGDIVFLGAPLLQTTTDGADWAVDYTNLRLPGAPARRFLPGA